MNGGECEGDWVMAIGWKFFLSVEEVINDNRVCLCTMVKKGLEIEKRGETQEIGWGSG